MQRDPATKKDTRPWGEKTPSPLKQRDDIRERKRCERQKKKRGASNGKRYRAYHGQAPCPKSIITKKQGYKTSNATELVRRLRRKPSKERTGVGKRTQGNLGKTERGT